MSRRIESGFGYDDMILNKIILGKGFILSRKPPVIGQIYPAMLERHEGTCLTLVSQYKELFKLQPMTSLNISSSTKLRAPYTRTHAGPQVLMIQGTKHALALSWDYVPN
jgi:hypothetical protein